MLTFLKKMPLTLMIFEMLISTPKKSLPTIEIENVNLVCC